MPKFQKLEIVFLAPKLGAHLPSRPVGPAVLAKRARPSTSPSAITNLARVRPWGANILGHPKIASIPSPPVPQPRPVLFSVPSPPSPPFVRGNTPAWPSVRGANLRGHPVAASTPPPRRLLAATQPRGRPRGATFATAVLQRRPRRQAAFLFPRRSSAVMFSRGYPCGELATGLGFLSPPHVRTATCLRPSALGTDRHGRLLVLSAEASDTASSPPLVRGDVSPRPSAQGANLSNCPLAVFVKRASAPPPHRTSAATHLP